MKNNEQGFGALGILVLVVVIGLIVAAGWLVWDRQKAGVDQQQATASTPQQTMPKSDKSEEVTPSDYVTYENKDAGFKFSYPKNWGTLRHTGGPQPSLVNDGLNGRILDMTFEGGDVSVFPRGNELRATTSASTDEGLYSGGYIEKNGEYYSVGKYSPEEVQIPEEKLLATVNSGLGKVLVLKTQTIAGTEVQLLLNLHANSTLNGISMRFKTGNYEFAEEGKLDERGLEVLRQVAKTFNQL